MATVRFGNYVITDNFIVGNLVKGFAKRNISTIDVPGRDGAILGSTTLSPIDITMTLTHISADPAERFSAFSELASKLNVSNPTALYISAYPSAHYMVVPNGGDLTRYVGAESFELTFTALDPVMYGDIPFGWVGTSTSVGGNYPTSPTITVESAVASDGVFGISVNGGTFDIPIGNALSHTIVIKSGNRTVTVDGSNVLPTLASDWPLLNPGSNTISITSGSGSVRGQYVERWLR